MEKRGRYVTTNLTPDEYELMKKTRAKAGLGEYQFLKDASGS